MRLGYLLSKATRYLKQDLNNRLQEVNLTVAQYILLRDISNYETQKEPEKYLNPACIAARLGADRPTITGIVHRLIEHGWITKKANPNDKRSFYLVLTNKSISLMPKLDELDDYTIQKAVSGFTETQINELIHYLSHIINNLNKGEERHE